MRYLKVFTVLFCILLFTQCDKQGFPLLTLNDCYIEELGEWVQCGTYEVMENRDVRRGHKFTLNFIVLPALNPNPAPDPIVVLSGGPGQGAADSVEWWALYFEKLRNEREIVLVDQRGTGASNPLPCQRIGDQESAQIYLQDMFTEDYVKRCRDELEEGNDLRYYHTIPAMADIDELRDALGYEKINLYGVSYGGHSAIVYMNNFPQSVRSVVLEAPGVPSLLYPSSLASDTEEVLERLFADCEADPDCAADYPNLRDEFYAVLHQLQQGPVTVNITNPINGQPETVTFTHNNFIHGCRSLLYNVYRQQWLPVFIYWAYRGNYSPLVEWVADHLYWINKSLMDGLLLCVTCTESIPYIDFEQARANAEGTFIGTYRLDQQQKACELWVRGDLPAGFHELPEADIPTLIITGDLDPVVRPYAGQFLGDSLLNSLHYSIPNSGHGIGTAWEDCLDDVVVQFFSQGSVVGLDFSCADSTQRPPFISWRDY
jgi:pimeloyl-ACP methyl ester carboxylesterase